MTDGEIFRHIDHTLLKAVSSWTEIEKLCAEAIRFKTASVCVPPSYVKPIHDVFGTLNICTVIGFPLGYSVSAAKVREAEAALADGASELDMVINLGDVKNGAFGRVEDEVSILKKIAGKKILKVIVETCYLRRDISRPKADVMDQKPWYQKKKYNLSLCKIAAIPLYTLANSIAMIKA